MTNLTEKEKLVFNAAIDEITHDYSASISGIKRQLEDLSINEIKGVVGSLVKKDMIDKGEKYKDVNGLTANHLYPCIKLKDGTYYTDGGYYCDNFDEEEIESFKIK